MKSKRGISSIHIWIIGFLSLVFILFAALQFNDPDPEVWVPIYLICTATGIGVMFSNLRFIFPAIFALIYLFGGIYLWPAEYHGVTGNMAEHPSIEYARESLGLFICSAAFMYFAYVAFLKSKKNR